MLKHITEKQVRSELESIKNQQLWRSTGLVKSLTCGKMIGGVKCCSKCAHHSLIKSLYYQQNF